MSASIQWRLAWRYLWARKSHSAVGAISAVSICGMAIATAAIICVMSVFNGFHAMMTERYDMLSPDLQITPLRGKTIQNADSLVEEIRSIPGVEVATTVIADQALSLYNGHELPITVRGIEPELYSRVTALDSLTIASDSIGNSDLPTANISIGIAASLKLDPGETLTLFTPRRLGRVNLSNPAASFITDSARVVSVFQSNQAEYDENLLFIDLDMARNLLQYDTEGSEIDIAAKPSANIQALKSEVEKKIGKDYTVKDRLEQQSNNFKMLNIEKWVTFLLLFFILIIASFNIISSLSMLVLEKSKSLATLRALGLQQSGVAGIFFRLSILVSAIGGVAGISLGVALVLIQERFGLIRIAGDPTQLVMTSYPVRLDPTDILITLIPLMIIAIGAGWITASFSKSRIKTE